ncbi:MAG: heterodisulfide reductase subunit B [Firmicutes bacterium]|nr:heterodisulfide reductase subunit B [Bacillota bacterium]
MKLSYYPGCSLESTAKEYDLSSRSVCAALDLELLELEDWSCCGSTSAHNLNHALASALPARNIALAQKNGVDVTVPCAACFARLRKADYVMRNDEAARKEIEETVGFKYQDNIKIMSLVEAMVGKVGLGAIASKVVKPLEGLKVVCYYGCLMVRPPEVQGFDRVENPTMLDDLTETLGAQALKWSYKTECCGASLSLTNTNVVEEIVSRIINAAREAGAEAIVTSCPMCQSNLEMRQEKGENQMPCFYFTELMGLALGLNEAKGWFRKHLVDPGRVVNL